MVLNEVSLGEEGVQQLDILFGETPYEIGRRGGRHSVCLAGSEEDTQFLSYDSGVFAIYFHPIGSFPMKIQNDIATRLSQVKAVSDLVERIREDYFSYYS